MAINSKFMQDDEYNIRGVGEQPENQLDSTSLNELITKTPELTDVLNTDQQALSQEITSPTVAETQSIVPNTPEKTLTRLEKLENMMADYESSYKKDLAEARKKDRMLQVGGALGDVLATYINAQNQKRAMVPGIEVQQGAGIGKIAEMFQTAPEVASDIAQRRQALMKQYAELAKGERSQSAIASKEKIAEERNKAIKEAAKLSSSRINENLDLRKQQYAQLGDSQVEKLATLKSGIDQANMLLPQLEKARKSLGIIGTPLAEVEAKFGKNPEFQKLQQDYASLRNTIRKDIFGATLTPGEAEEFDKELKTIGISDKELGTSIQGLINRTKLKVRSRLNTIAETQPLKAETARNAIKTFGLEEQQSPTVDYESKIDKVLKANPGSSRQQVINALKKDKKLPMDYK